MNVPPNWLIGLRARSELGAWESDKDGRAKQ